MEVLFVSTSDEKERATPLEEIYRSKKHSMVRTRRLTLVKGIDGNDDSLIEFWCSLDELDEMCSLIVGLLPSFDDEERSSNRLTSLCSYDAEFYKYTAKNRAENGAVGIYEITVMVYDD